MDLDLGTRARRVAQTRGLPAPPPPGWARREPRSGPGPAQAWQCPAQACRPLTLHQAQEGPGPLGATGAHGAAGGLGLLLPPRRSCLMSKAPKPQAQRGREGPSAMLSAW